MKQILLAGLLIIFALSLAAMGTYADFSDTEPIEGNILKAGSLDLQVADTNEDFSNASDSLSQTWFYATVYPGGMAPGDSLESAVYFRNVGSIRMGSLEVHCHITDSELDNDTDAENLAENLLLTSGIGKDNDGDSLIDEDPVDGLDNDADSLVDEDPPAGVPVPVTAGRGVYDKDRAMIISYMKYQNATAINIVWGEGNNWDPAYIQDTDGDNRITLFDFKKQPVTSLPPPESGLASFSMQVMFGEASWNLNQYQGDRTDMTLVFALMQ